MPPLTDVLFTDVPKAGEDQFQSMLRGIVSKAIASIRSSAPNRTAAATGGGDDAAAAQDEDMGVGAADGGEGAGNGSAAAVAGSSAPQSSSSALSTLFRSRKPRLLSTETFLLLVGELGGFKKVLR
jgi:hypothetical protein